MKERRLKRTRFILALLSNAAGAYLISQGHVETGAILMGGSGSAYIGGQSWTDAAEAKARAAVRDAVDGLAGD